MKWWLILYIAVFAYQMVELFRAGEQIILLVLFLSHSFFWSVIPMFIFRGELQRNIRFTRSAVVLSWASLVSLGGALALWGDSWARALQVEQKVTTPYVWVLFFVLSSTTILLLSLVSLKRRGGSWR